MLIVAPLDLLPELYSIYSFDSRENVTSRVILPAVGSTDSTTMSARFFSIYAVVKLKSCFSYQFKEAVNDSASSVYVKNTTT